MNDTIETLKARIAELEASDAHNERRWRNEEAAKHQVMGYRDEWRARAEAAEARLAEIGAPAEGVDPSEVLRLDREPWHKRVGKRRSGPWTTALALDTSEEDGLDPEQVLLVGRLVAENLRGLDADQILADRAAAPALARALIAARADLSALRSLDQPVASALCRRAQVRLLASIGAPMSRRETPARLGLALLLLDGSAADVQTYLRAVEPCLDQRARSGLLAMLLRAAALGRSGRRATVEEVIRA